MNRRPFHDFRKAAGARSGRGLLSCGQASENESGGPSGAQDQIPGLSQPGIFDVVADLFSVPGPIAVAGLSTGQSGRLGAPPWRPPKARDRSPAALVVIASAALHVRSGAGGFPSGTIDAGASQGLADVEAPNGSGHDPADLLLGCAGRNDEAPALRVAGILL